MKKRIAIIGGGIAGLTAAYLLDKKHDITLFEKDDRVGGNAYTHKTSTGETFDIAVGSVLNRVAGNFLKLCDELDVKLVRQPKASLISIHDLESDDGLYLTPLSIKGLFAQKFALFKYTKSFIKTAYANYKAVRLLEKGRLKDLTVEDMFSLLPELTRFEKLAMMAPFCLLSSMQYKEVSKGPSEYFAGKMKAHGKFNPVITMLGNYFPKHFTQSYVDALIYDCREKVVLNSNIKAVKRNEAAVFLQMKDGKEYAFDKVVFACNADQALSLLDNPTEDEKRLLGAWIYKDVPMVVHRDQSNSPGRELCQPWTLIQSSDNGVPHFSIHYCSWLLSPAALRKCDYFSTQHPSFPIREDLIDIRKIFRVPFYDFKSFGTIQDLPSLNGNMHSYYCGSHFGYGLHGDAVNSAIEVARHLGIDW
ncbi:MAG: FAD-dependent oxidoreductase [Proteobacteria bacterium]|nr:FAD-dependent oxidoreductase [Pseudomonadota bacterium]